MSRTEEGAKWSKNTGLWKEVILTYLARRPLTQRWGFDQDAAEMFLQSLDDGVGCWRLRPSPDTCFVCVLKVCFLFQISSGHTKHSWQLHILFSAIEKSVIIGVQLSVCWCACVHGPVYLCIIFIINLLVRSHLWIFSNSSCYSPFHASPLI